MSALGSLIGIGCAACKRKGHYCQAQMWEECEELEGETLLKFRKPLCLRCADGELCIYVTAARIDTPERLLEEVDLCLVPKATVQDLAYVAALGKAPSMASEYGHRAERYAGWRNDVLQDLFTMTVKEAAAKYQVSTGRISHIKSAEQTKRRNAALAQKLREPVWRVIGGEVVNIAPLASMGAEMLEISEAPASESVWERLLSAVRAGCKTSEEVAAHTHISKANCTSYMSRLCKMGHVRVVGKQKVATGGVLANLYEAVEPNVASA